MPSMVQIGTLNISLLNITEGQESLFLARALNDVVASTHLRKKEGEVLLALALIATLKSMAAQAASRCLVHLFEGGEKQLILTATETGFGAGCEGETIAQEVIERWLSKEVREGIADAHCVNGFLRRQGLLPSAVEFRGEHAWWFAGETYIPPELADT